MKSFFHSPAMIIIFCLLSFACKTTLKSGSYCYRCCACVGSGVLRIFENGCFEIEYEHLKRPRDKYGEIYYGQGTYHREKGKIDLVFEEIPRVHPSIVLTRIGESDNVDIKLNSVYDSINMISLPGADFAFREGSGNKNIKKGIIYNPKQENHLILDLKKLSKASLANLLLEATFIGCRPASCAVPPPGLYTADVVLPFGYADVQFDAGHRKLFKVTETLDGIMIRDKSDPTIYFTTQTCGCD